MVTVFIFVLGQGKASPEDEFYPIHRYKIPEGIVLEAGGLELMPDGKLAVSTRRGEIYMVEGAADNPKFSLWASGLHEVLGLAYRDGWLFATQRCEITKIKDSDGDGRADVFKTVCDKWAVTGDYHEYAFGTKFDREGRIWIVLCLTGSFTSDAPYRGWAVRVSADGTMIPTCSGIRSPGGIGFNYEGDAFYCDNQGTWNGTSSLKHLKPGSFQGNPNGNKWYSIANMGPKPKDPLSGGRSHIEAEKIPEYVPPAVLLPHGKVGNSASGIAADISEGKFGPFARQLFVADQSASVVNRCFLEKINGRYQGAVFPFRKGFGSGNVPIMFTQDGSLFAGGTNRGWGSSGPLPFALERVAWTGKVPFEIHEMRIKPDGFELTFTRPVDKASAAALASYKMDTYTYVFRSDYGSPEVDKTTPTIKSATVAADGMSVRLVVEGLQIGHVHDLKLPGLKSTDGKPLLHPVAYYTLWNLPK